MKICTKCKAEKPQSEFHADKRRKDGLRPHCMQCVRASVACYRAANLEKARASCRRSRRDGRGVPLAEYRARLAEQRAARMATAAAKRAIRMQLAAEKRRAKALQTAQKYRDRYRSDPEFQLYERMRRAMRKHKNLAANLGSWMRQQWTRGGQSRKIESLCGYTLAQLRAHLEGQFTEGMTWKRFMEGEIHIDHIIPMSAFDMTNPEQFRRCWSFDNLQPLWAADNTRKSDRLPDGRSARALRGLKGTVNACLKSGACASAMHHQL